MKVVIAGTGYVGLVTGVCLAEIGHDVTCIDVDKEKVNKMRKGQSPIYEKDLEALMLKNKERLTYTTDYKTAYKTAEIIFIAVGTPEKSDGSVELTYIYEVASQIATSIENNCVVAIKSTVPIGTNRKVEAFIRQNLTHPVHIEIASNPEFLAQGQAVQDTLECSRIVIGTDSSNSQTILKQLYKDFKCPIICTNLESAEIIKYAANSFLALKISYINEIALLCEKVGANVEEVAYSMGLDPRIGPHFLKAGIGYGGSCFPKDTKALHWIAGLYEYDLKTVEASIQVNALMQLALMHKLNKYYPRLKGLNISILGLTFKPGTDDLREAPSLKNIPILLASGANLRAYDPIGATHYKKHYPHEIVYCNSIEEALANTDVCFIFTEWPEIKSFNVKKFASLMKKPIILDGRNCYDLEQFKDIPVIYESIGRPSLNYL